jgi:hypothetical protein
MENKINALEVLAEMEEFRKNNQNEKKSPSDFCMRCLEAILAKAAGYGSRMEWVAAVQRLQKTKTE